MSTPLVSVIINCRNGAAFLAAAIDSVYAQSLPDWEIIFFDNRSTDESAAIALSYDARLRYFQSDTILSLGAARNKAAAQAQGQYLCFLDCDDLWTSDKLQSQVDCLKSSPLSGRPIEFCYTDAERIASDGSPLLSYAHERKLYAGNVYTRLIQDCFMSCSSVMMSRAGFMAVGGFDPQWHQVEDWDLWLRLSRTYDVAYLNKATTKIRLHSNNQSGNIFAHFHEKITLLDQLQQKDPSVTRLCRRAQTQLRLQRQVSALLLTRPFSLYSSMRILGELTWEACKHPIALILTFRKYANPQMFSLFKYKFYRQI